jgi:hypothetical protein
LPSDMQVRLNSHEGLCKRAPRPAHRTAILPVLP